MKKIIYIGLIVLSTNLFAQLSGTYQVGSGGDYTTLTEAVADLNTNGISGPVIFELTDASYNSGTGETFPITINEITNANSYYTLTIRPASGVTAEISGSSGGENTCIIKFYGADYVTIDGSNNGTTSRDLTIKNTYVGGWNAIIWLASLGNDQGCTNNTIKNCILPRTDKSYTYPAISLSDYSHVYLYGGYDNNNNTIENNYIYNAGTGIVIKGKSDEYNTGNIVRNNLMGNDDINISLAYKGVGAYYQSQILITGNEIYNFEEHYGLTTNPTGIYIYYCDNVEITKNKIHDMYASGSDAGRVKGIDIYIDVADPQLTIANNMIWAIASLGASNEYPIGISIYGASENVTTSGVYCYFNSIYLTPNSDFGLDYAGAYSAGIYLAYVNGGMDFRNNIIRNSLGEKVGSTAATSCYGIYIYNTYNPFSNCDNNIYYTNSTSDNNYIGRKNGGNYATLSALQAFTGGDLNSFNEVPDFTAETNLDLTLENNNAVYLTDFQYDVYGDYRKPTPDIGADEYAFMPRVTTDDVTEIYCEKANGNGTVESDNGYSVSERGICWNSNGNPTIADNIVTSGSGEGSFSGSITELNGITNYYARAYATNSQGTAYGEDIAFTTFAEPQGNMLDFDGADDYLTSELTLPDNGTIEFWIYFDTYGIQTIWHNSLAVNAWIMKQNNGRIYCYTGAGTSLIMSTNAYSSLEWNHIALTWSKDTENNQVDAILYINGNLEGTLNNITWTNPASTLYIGSNYGGDNYLNAKIDEFRIWDVNRGAAGVLAGMHKTYSSTTSNLICYYRFDAESGSVLSDNTQYGFNATLNNMTDAAWTTSTAPFGFYGVPVRTTAVTSIGASGKTITATITNSPNLLYNYLGIYASGKGDDYINSGEIFPAGVTKRSNIIWGVEEYGDVTSDLTFDYSNITGIVAESELKLLKRSSASSDWTDITTSANRNTTNHTFTLTDVTVYSEFSIGGDDSALPVELTSFTTAIVENGKVKLEWQTETEVNNYGFEIERQNGEVSSQNSEWEKVGFVEGSGNSNSIKEYSFTDNSVTSRVYSYKLKQIDIDGNYKYSEILSVEIRRGESLPQEFTLHQNYPNPFNPTTVIKFDIPEDSKVKLEIYNILGQRVLTMLNIEMEAGFHEISFNANNLTSGLYFYRIQADSFIDTKKMILMK